MYSASKGTRTNRNSVFNTNGSHALTNLRAKIKSLDRSSKTNDHNTQEYDPFSYGVELVPEPVIVYNKSKMVRRAYLIESKYKIGWVVDCDLNLCMICLREFGWYRGRTKHHCRACGALVCHDCSPYMTEIAVLNEERGSRVCKNCFCLKPGIFTPPSVAQSPNTSENTKLNSSNLPAKNLFKTPEESKGNTSSPSKRKSVKAIDTEEKMMQKYLEEMERIDKEQLPKYEEAYR
jgi:hypothetical protein